MRYYLLASSLLLTGCAQMFPASYHEMEPGKYQLSSSGNVFASIETLKGKIDKRAAELCGQDNYVYSDDGDFSTPHSPAYMNGVDIGASYKVLNRKIECKKS